MSRQRARKLATSLLIPALLGPAVSFADIYKWVDANGQVHFGDKAPEVASGSVTTIAKDDKDGKNQPAVTVETSSQEMQTRQARFADQLRDERMKREKAMEHDSEIKKKQAANCEFVKNRIEHMKGINIFYDIKPDGSVRYLSDKEGDKVRKEAEQMYQQHCAEKATFASAH